MNLRMLAPDIQEAILFLPRTETGRDPIHVRQLQPIALVPDWRKQRRMWNLLAAHLNSLAPERSAKRDKSCQYSIVS